MGDTIIEAPAPEGIASRPLRSSGSAKPQIAAATSAFSRYGFAPSRPPPFLIGARSSSKPVLDNDIANCSSPNPPPTPQTVAGKPERKR